MLKVLTASHKKLSEVGPDLEAQIAVAFANWPTAVIGSMQAPTHYQGKEKSFFYASAIVFTEHQPTASAPDTRTFVHEGHAASVPQADDAVVGAAEVKVKAEKKKQKKKAAVPTKKKTGKKK